MDVTILTAAYGGYDEIRGQVEQDIPVRWLAISEELAPKPWSTIRVTPSDVDPRRAAKVWKLTPWNAVSRGRVIWIDANTEITSPSFAREALDFIRDGIGLFRHPRRDCIYAEGEASLGAESQGGKYDAEPIPQQLASYRAEGHPEHWGLWAGGTIAWDLDARELGEAWLEECERWSCQDQISLPVVCWRLGIRPGEFPHPQITRRRPLANRWQIIHPHLR